jgi:predicted DNA-binding transcriptional regulator AlpA
MDPVVLSVAQFCARHCISRAQFYQLLKAGLAPKTFFVGRRRFITVDAAREWLAGMEKQSSSQDPHVESPKQVVQ